MHQTVDVSPMNLGITSEYFRLKFKAIIGLGADGALALDDVSIHNLLCSQLTTTEKPGCAESHMICDFVTQCPDGSDEENCGIHMSFNGETYLSPWFDNEQSGEFRWLAMKAADASIDVGPNTDHTEGNKEGYYATLVPNVAQSDLGRGSIKLPEAGSASLMSPVYYNAFKTCRMDFFIYYNFKRPVGEKYNDTHGAKERPGDWLTLNVRLIRPDEEPVIIASEQYPKNFTSQSYSGKSWEFVGAYIYRVPKAFQIEFQARRTVTADGHLRFGIDDISLVDCNVPPPDQVCGEFRYKCENGHCIPSHEICDFQDDCGDFSDEAEHLVNCTTEAVGRCDFYDGICDWVQDYSDDADFFTMLPSENMNQGAPTRDHTTNSGNGRYLTVFRRPVEAEVVRANLISPTIKARYTGTEYQTTCNLRFFYHMGGNAGSISVLTRTEESEEWKELWKQSSDVFGKWEKADLFLAGLEVGFGRSLQVQIRAEYTDPMGDITIDDVSFSTGCQLGDPLPSTGSTTPQPECDLDDEFECPEGKCIPFEELCNFETNCPSTGKDEAVCATCDFRDDLCGWIDDGTGETHWQWSGDSRWLFVESVNTPEVATVRPKTHMMQTWHPCTCTHFTTEDMRKKRRSSFKVTRCQTWQLSQLQPLTLATWTMVGSFSLKAFCTLQSQLKSG